MRVVIGGLLIVIPIYLAVMGSHSSGFIARASRAELPDVQAGAGA
jgi:hypothetical protein